MFRYSITETISKVNYMTAMDWYLTLCIGLLTMLTSVHAVLGGLTLR